MAILAALILALPTAGGLVLALGSRRLPRLCNRKRKVGIQILDALGRKSQQRTCFVQCGEFALADFRHSHAPEGRENIRQSYNQK